MKNLHIEKMVKHFGGVSKMACVFGVSQTAVNKWRTGETHISAERALQFEKKTDGLVTRHDLRPDIFD